MNQYWLATFQTETMVLTHQSMINIKSCMASPPAGEDHSQEFTQDTGEDEPDQKATNKDHVGISETATA